MTRTCQSCSVITDDCQIHRFAIVILALLIPLLLAPKFAIGQAGIEAVPTTKVSYGPQFRDITRSLTVDELALIEEYRVNYERLRDFYGNAQIEALNHEIHWSGRKSIDNPEGRATRRLIYRSRGQKLYRLDVEQFDWKSGNSTGIVDVYAAGPETHFHARKSRPTRGFAVLKTFQSRDEISQILSIYRFYQAPYSHYAIPLQSLIFGTGTSNNWRIESVRASESEGRRLVSINGRAGVEGQKQFAGKYVFLRDLSWALKEFSHGAAIVTTRGDEVRKGSIEYDGHQDGIPLLKHLTYWVEVGPERERTQVEDYLVTSFIPGAVAEADFLPSALSLSIGGTKANWVPRVIVLLSGAALVALYLYLKRRAPA